VAVHLLRFEEIGRSLVHTTATPQASATWEVHDLTKTRGATGYIVASGVATVDTAAVDLMQEAGPGTDNARRILVASTGSLSVGRRYLLSDSQGSEVVTIEGIALDVYTDLVYPLSGTYTVENGARLQGLRITATLPNTIAANEDHLHFNDPLRIVWSYGDGQKHQEQIRVVRHDYGDLSLPDIKRDVLDLFPDVHQRIEHSGKGTLDSMIAAVMRIEHAAILADGDEPDRVLHGDQGRFVIVWATLAHMAAMNVRPGSDDDPALWLEHCGKQYNRFFGTTRRGTAGARTTAIGSPVTESAIGTNDPTARQRIRWG